MTAETTEPKTLEQIDAHTRQRADSIPQLHSFATNNDSMALLLRSIADQIEATAKRAYNEIDKIIHTATMIAYEAGIGSYIANQATTIIDIATKAKEDQTR